MRFLSGRTKPVSYTHLNIKVHYSKLTGEWNVEGKSYDRGNLKAYNTYGTKRVNAYKTVSYTHRDVYKRQAMAQYAGKYPDSAFQGNYATEYGFRAETEKYSFLIRCNPARGMGIAARPQKELRPIARQFIRQACEMIEKM